VKITKQTQPLTSQTAQAAPISTPKPTQSGADSIGQLPPTPVICPKPLGRELDAEQIKLISGVGGAGIKGYGTLTGEIAVLTRFKQDAPGTIGYEEQKAVLITHGKGSRSQVSFQLDLDPQAAKAVEGQLVQVSGDLEKTSMYGGKVSGAQLGESLGIKPGSYTQVSGSVENRQLVGIGGEAPPSGSWLVLDKPLTVGGEQIAELYLGQDAYADGASVKLNGRIDLGSWGGVETPPSRYYSLSGVSDLGRNEPIYDGQGFTSSVSGKPLDTLSWTRPLVTDIPATVWILDQGQDKAFIASMGGFIPPWMNPFHGIREARAIELPTAADRAKIGVSADGAPYVKATGDKLELISKEEPPPGTADGMSQAWYLDAKTQELYRFASGGIAGFVLHMEQVVRGASEVVE